MKLLKNILEYGLYLFVFLLPWQTKLILRSGWLNRGVWDYGTIALYGTDILLIGLLIVFSILSWRIKNNRPQPLLEKEGGAARPPFSRERESFEKDEGAEITLTHTVLARRESTPLKRGILIIFSGLDLVIFISIFFASDKVLAVYRYALFLLGLGLFWLIIKAKYSKAKLAIAFFSGLAIQGILAVWQFLTQETFVSKWLGMARHSPVDLGVSVVETYGAGGIPERWLRAYGALDHPNILGGFMAIGLVIIIQAIINNQRISNKKTDFKFIIYHLSFIILFVGLIFSFSRSALAGFAAGLIVFFIFYLIKKNWPAIKKLSGVFILSVVLFGAIFINYQSLFITRAVGTARLETNSTFERKMYLNDSFSLLKKDWLFGTGIGNYTKALSENDLQRPWYYLQPVHNVFLLVWAEIGIFGLLFYIAIFIYLFGLAFKKNNALGLSVLAVLAIIMILDHYFWSLHFGILFFFGLLGYLFKNISSSEA